MVRQPLSLHDAWRLFELSADRGLDETLREVVDHCSEWFDAPRASLFLAAEDGRSFEFVAGDAKLKGYVVRAGVGIAGRAVETGEALLVADPNQHPLLKGRRIEMRRHLGSSIIVPLRVPGGPSIGVLNLARSVEQPVFTEEDVSRVQAVAHQVALAVSNARLVDRLAKAESKLSGVIERLGVAVLVVDPRGDIERANAEALRLLPECAEVPTLERWPESDPLHDAVRSLALKAHHGEANRRRVTHDGFAYSVVAAPLPSGGATVTIEETTAYEQAIEEVSRMKRLAEIGQMTAAIAHEIRNPLTGIRSAAQLVKIAPEQADECADIIDGEVLKLNGLCEEFLEFARPLAIRPAPMRLSDVLRGVAARLQRDFNEREIRLDVEIDESTPIIHADALRLEQVARNLLLNALQACAKGGRVALRASGRHFEVIDDGCGMSEEQRAKLFTPFFTTKANGTGLGLSTMRKIIDAHRGTIRVESECGKGSRFSVELPEDIED